MDEARVIDQRNATVAELTREPDKTLMISFEDGHPIFEFQGLWSGRDIETIKRLLSRQYHQYTREIRINERRGK